MKRYILTCSCHNMDKKGKEAFGILFPGEPIPEVIKGRDRLYKFARKLRNEHILAISKLTGKFAYYVKLEGNVILEEYDLNTMEKIA